jgi:hypothetical protein
VDIAWKTPIIKAVRVDEKSKEAELQRLDESILRNREVGTQFAEDFGRADCLRAAP